MNSFNKYIKVWWIFSFNSFQTQVLTRGALMLFLIAKLLRFFIFFIFIIILLDKTKVLAGYTLDQTIFFFLSFSLIDTLVQTIFREVYRFRPTIVNGTFDYYLIKPFNPLFRALATGPDLTDLFLLIPLIGAIIYYMERLGINNLSNILVYILMLLVGIVIALAFHILVLALAILTTEIDHAILVYRDVTGMGRFPLDIYREPVRGILTFVLPVGIMMSFPAKAILGLLSPQLIMYAISFSVILLIVSIKIWKVSLKQYSSASS